VKGLAWAGRSNRRQPNTKRKSCKSLQIIELSIGKQKSWLGILGIPSPVNPARFLVANSLATTILFCSVAITHCAASVNPSTCQLVNHCCQPTVIPSPQTATQNPFQTNSQRPENVFQSGTRGCRTLLFASRDSTRCPGPWPGGRPQMFHHVTALAGFLG